MKKTILFILLIGTFYDIFAQDSLYRSTVQDVLAVGVQENLNEVSASLATKSEKSLPETPAVIAVMTSKEIEMWGCRDIADVLRLIPGFEFGIDVTSLVGLSFRGIWAHEGKVLMMINGLTVNCFGYGNSNFFGTYPAAMIEKIEIIRGPGSALYGTFAEVAVINIITKSTDSHFNFSGGMLGKSPLYDGNLRLSLEKDKNKKISFQAGLSNSTFSNSLYRDFFGNEMTFDRLNAWRKWYHITAEAQYNRFYFSYTRIQNNYLAQDGFAEITLPSAGNVNEEERSFYNESASLKYDIPLKKNFLLQPRFEFSRGNSISAKLTPPFEVDSLGNYHLKSVSDIWENQRFKAGKYAFDMNAYYTDEKNELILGAGVQLHTAESATVDGRYGFRLSTHAGDSAQFLAKTSQFVLLQYIRKMNHVDFIAGSRYEMTIFGNAFAPRFGLIYHKNKFHGKLLYGRSFRVPLFWQAFSEQYFTGVPLKPEISNTLEGEIGCKFSQNLSALLNLFWTEVKQPITYIGANNSYQNFGEIVSIGAESEIHYRDKSQNVWLNFSYFMPGKKTSEGFLNEEKTAFLAVPALKINAAYGFEAKKFTAGLSATYMGKKYAQTQFSALNSVDSLIRQTSSTPSAIFLNVNFSVKKILKKSDVFLTVKNILNTRYWLMQPYYGAHAPMPAFERQINLTVKVSL